MVWAYAGYDGFGEIMFDGFFILQRGTL